MGLLVGLPLKILHILFLALRFLWPLVVIFVVRWLVKKLRNTRFEPRQKQSSQPDFDGPVYTVDYEEVPEDET